MTIKFKFLNIKPAGGGFTFRSPACDVKPAVLRLIMLIYCVFVMAVGECKVLDLNTYAVTYYRMSDGLCDNRVFDIYRDSRGFMWFCTSNGLDRFDGNGYVHYSIASTSKAHHTKSNYFMSAEEDDFGYVWVSTDVGLMRISPSDGSIMEASDLYDDPDGYLSSSATSTVKDFKGRLWVAAGECIYYIDFDNGGGIKNIEAKECPDRNISVICRQGDMIWAGGRDGLSRFAVAVDGKIQTVPLDGDMSLGSIKNVTAIFVRGVYLNIGTSDSGLYRYNMQSREMLHFSHNPDDANSLSDNHISSIATNDDGDMVIGTRMGISLLANEGKFVNIGVGSDGAVLSDNYINDVYVDKDDNIWASTVFGGVNLIYKRERGIFRLLCDVDAGHRTAVTALHRDDDGTLFAGVLERGLRIFKFNEGRYTLCYNSDALGDDAEAMSGRNVTDIVQDINGDYWIATMDGGLNLLKKDSLGHPKFRKFTVNNSNIRSDALYGLVVDEIRRGLWVCFSDGVQFYDIATGEFTNINMLLGDLPPMKYMRAIMLDSKNRLWIGGDGLLVLDLNPEMGQMLLTPQIYYRHKLDAPESGISERISTMTEVEDGTVYIGSQNNGLYICKQEENGGMSFVHHSIFGNKISDIVPGVDKCIWISTVDGVYYFDRQSLRTVRYDASDGIPETQFYVDAGVSMPGGGVCLGSVDGAVIINPPGHVAGYGERKVIVTSVVIQEDNIQPLDKPVYELGPDENSITISFSAQDYVHPDKVAYAYKIEELGQNWTVDRTVRKVRYTGLKPGLYTFSVRCTNSDKLWSTQETKFKILVRAPFYQTWWFYCLAGLVVLSLTGLIILIYSYRQKKIQKFLIDKVRQRTQRLTEQTVQLRQKNEEINKQKTQLEEFSKQIENSNKEKSMMFTSLTHEFKTPLTLILGPARKLIRANKNPDFSESLQIIDRNAHHLLSLVNQMMDLRLIDAKRPKLNNAPFNIVDEFNDDVTAFSDLLSERNIEMATRIRCDAPNIVGDRSFIHKILFNLISNAIKYTPNGGHIVCRLAQRRRVDSNLVSQYISVSNSGSYISPDECMKIFECFYKIDNQQVYTSYGQSNTGIGLFLVKQIVVALGGEITVKSVENKGTTFRVCFPLEVASELPVVSGSGIMDAVILEDEAEEVPFDMPQERDKPVILLVEDSRDMRTYIRGLLEDKYYVAEAINGERGYAMAQKIVPDFIISDMMMPKCDGLEFCRLIRSNSELCHIPFLMLTALSDYDSRFESYKERVDAYLTKPFEPEMLLARIDAISVNRMNMQKVIAADLSNPYPSVEMEDPNKMFLKKLTDTMKQNYSDPEFSANTLVELMGMSAPKLYHKINALTGMTAVSYIRLYRLQTARRIMEDNGGKKGISVSEIAYLVGFNDPKYFTRCFVKQFGIQPRAFMNDGF